MVTDHKSNNERIRQGEWAGGIADEPAAVPAIRIGRRWVSTAWLVPLTIAALIVGVAIAQHLRQHEWMQEFILRYPGTSAPRGGIEPGLPAWLRWSHLFNIVFMMFIIRAGLQILADHPRLYLNSGSTPGTAWLRLRGPIPADRLDPAEPARVWTAKDDSVSLPKWLGIPGVRHTIGLARWWHFTFDTLWLLNGVVFYVLLFATGQWRRIVPQSWDVIPNAASTMVQYLSLDFPVNDGFVAYNALQLTAYFLTVFVFAPLAFVTGILQAPAIAARFGFGAGPANRQVARSVHFLILAWMVFFIAIHTIMVFTTGLLGNLNHIVFGTDTESYWALVIYLIAMGVIIALWLLASPVTLRYPRLVQRVGRFAVGWIKGLMEWVHPKAEYSERDISPYFWPNGTLPASSTYRELAAGNWSGYTLRVGGQVENPTELSYADLLAMPKHDQITQHYCIQGWSGVAKWGGVRMADILDIVRPLPSARWVVFYSMADGSEPGGGRYYDCHRISHMRHPMALLAYEMNDAPLTETHGAPLRLRNEVELGFKQVKWIESIEFVDSFDHIGKGQGGYNEDHEYFGFRMPI
ncbi:oxidoreductase [Mycolicibacterium neoaurum]|uniref:Oxidoreductase n=1 Tax=Mycolicibacterium neoaurum VKM Ac-1815D TaxID=700508 RepID=V5XI83_MYCNE|nr:MULTISPECIES: molybdopterin-dependent oxidoreductase [Mycobacteriaceae]AHC27109.1 oxidoreductase [Mycolicibacterium neoaurum VKM Ac-1815D]KJQ51328.1 oxidoreductase [Mycolicibacterium neoaurum]